MNFSYYEHVIAKYSNQIAMPKKPITMKVGDCFQHIFTTFEGDPVTQYIRVVEVPCENDVILIQKMSIMPDGHIALTHKEVSCEHEALDEGWLGIPEDNWRKATDRILAAANDAFSK